MRVALSRVKDLDVTVTKVEHRRVMEIKVVVLPEEQFGKEE